MFRSGILSSLSAIFFSLGRVNLVYSESYKNTELIANKTLLIAMSGFDASKQEQYKL